MRAFEYIVTKTGTLVYPTTQPEADINRVSGEPNQNQITLVFYNTIDLITNPPVLSDPVLSGLTGTVTVQARPTPASAWANIVDGTLDLATGGNAAFPLGLISGVKITPDSVTGCNYILVRLDRSA